MDAATLRYICVWAGLGIAAVTLVALLDGVPAADPVAVTALLAAAVVAERIELTFPFPRASASFTLIEVAITASLLLLPSFYAVAVAILGTAGAQVLWRAAPVKLVFAASQAAVAVSVAALTLRLLPDVGPQVAGRSVLGATLGMSLYVLVNVVAILGLFRRLDGPEGAQAVRTQIPLTSATMVGQIATGVVLAAIVDVDARLAPFVVAPAAAVYFAAKGATRTTDLLTRVRFDRDRLTRVISGASDGIILLDRSGTVQVWNRAMQQLTGLEADDVVDHPVDQVLRDDIRIAEDPVRGRWLVETAHEAAPHREIDAVLRHVDGSEHSVRESHALVYDDRGRCTGDVVIVRDVSRQQELERLRSDFVARVSHELRTPLTPIRGFASVLLHRGESMTGDQRAQALQSILERADHLGTVVEDLLLVTRLDRGELDAVVEVRPTDLQTVVEPIVDGARRREPARAIDFVVAPGTSAALADPGRLTKVVEALLDNACRYSPPDGAVEVTLSQVGDDILVSISDHGPGIPRDKRDVVFERFSRLEDPMTMRTGGVGLGLFLSRQLVTAMHGTLTFGPSRPEGGTTLTVRLPAAEPSGN